MVTHIVMWNVKDEAEGLSKKDILNKMKSELESLRGRVPARTIEVGINEKIDTNSWDIALYSTFESFDALEEYQKHPEHLKVGQFVGKVRKDRAVVDYES